MWFVCNQEGENKSSTGMSAVQVCDCLPFLRFQTTSSELLSKSKLLSSAPHTCRVCCHNRINETWRVIQLEAESSMQNSQLPAPIMKQNSVSFRAIETSPKNDTNIDRSEFLRYTDNLCLKQIRLLILSPSFRSLWCCPRLTQQQLNILCFATCCGVEQ